MIIERKRLLRTSSDSNPAIINMNAGIEAMRRNVRTTVNSVLRLSLIHISTRSTLPLWPILTGI